MTNINYLHISALVLRHFKALGLYGELQKRLGFLSKQNNFNDLCNKELKDVVSICNSDPYNRLFFTDYGISVSYKYCDIIKDQNILSLVLFLRYTTCHTMIPNARKLSTYVKEILNGK